MLLNIIVGVLLFGFIGLGTCVYKLMKESEMKTKKMKKVNYHANREYNKIYNEKIKGYKDMNEIQRSKVTYDIITDFSGKIEDLHYENVYLNNKIEVMNKDFKIIKEQINELSMKVTKLETENHELKSRVYNLERENSGQGKYITNVVDKLKNASLNLN